MIFFLNTPSGARMTAMKVVLTLLTFNCAKSVLIIRVDDSQGCQLHSENRIQLMLHRMRVMSIWKFTFIT